MSSAAPTSGFCIKLTTRSHELYYVNVCSHSALEPPLNARDEPVSAEHIDVHGIDNLRVPVLTGPLRTIAVGDADEEVCVPPVHVARIYELVVIYSMHGTYDLPAHVVRAPVFVLMYA